MKSVAGIIVVLGLCLSGIYFFVKASSKKVVPSFVENGATMLWKDKMTQKAQKLKRYASMNGYNSDLGILIDMHLESGNNRIFLYDLKHDSILFKGLVTHGRCNERWLEGRKYDNEPGCGCSSLGYYKVGNKYNGKFGLAYKLYGLDTSNSNAFARFVVLHAHECVPEKPIFPDPICQSDGCPTVSPSMIVKLGQIIDKSKKPMLLYIFDEE